MGFHAYTKPTDYVTCNHSARQGIYGDDNLTSNAVRIKLGYLGGPLEDGFGRADSTAGLPGTAVEVGAVIAGGVQLYKWNLSPRGLWGAAAGKAYNSNGSARAVCWIDSANVGVTNVGGNRTNADLSVEVSATVRAGLARVQSDNNHLVCILDIAAARVKVIDIRSTFDNTTLFTGTTPISAGVTYTLRLVNVGSSYSVYLNGVLEGTFSESFYSPQAVKPGIHAHNDSAARFNNLRLAKASNPVASTYTLRNYLGNVIKTGSITNEYIDLPDADLTVDGVAGHKYGWYKLYLTGADHVDGQWGTAYGDCTFIRVPPYSGFPSNGGISAANLITGNDEISRGVMAMGINRYKVDNAAIAPATSIAALQPAVTLMKEWWVDNADPVRPRKTLIAFPYEYGANAANVTAIVNGLKTWVKAWSARNEPNFFVSPETFVGELATFNAAVKAADPTATVMGPGTVSFGQYGLHMQGIQYFKEFLAAGGDAHCDAYDVHPYNCYNGDLQSMRHTLGGLKDAISANGNPAKDIYQTEQGYGHAFAGQYTPSYAARWTALMVFAQEVLTMGRMRSENSFYWYDGRIGFDNFPMWWLDASGPGPQPCAIRTQSAETRGKTIIEELDFGHTGQQMYCGGVWSDGTDKVIGVIAASYRSNSIRFAVTGSSTFTRVDSWGNQTTLTAAGGYVTLTVSELGCWLRVPSGTTAALVPGDWSWGTNVCLAGTAFTSATPPPDQTDNYANLERMNNDDYESWYSRGGTVVVGTQFGLLNNPFVHLDQTYPMQDGVLFASTTINRIAVVCAPPWHDFGTMLDFDLQTFNGTTWTTRQTWNNTGDYTWVQFVGVDRCTSEFFWPEQWIFEHKAVSPITCQGVRVNVRTNSHGGFPNLAIQQANDNGQGGWGYWLYIREIQAFNTTGEPVPPPAPPTVRPIRRRFGG